MAELVGLAGIGVDVEDVDRWQAPDLRLFTEREIAHCQAQGNPAESFAGRWCAKEAVVKALWSRVRLSPRDVEILSDADGAPQVALSAGHISLGRMVHVSISHTRTTAIAMAAVIQPQPADPARDEDSSA